MWKRIKQKKIIYNFIKAFIVALVLLIGVLVGLRFYTNHGEKIETPNFIGLSIEEAKTLADEHDLRLFIDSVYSAKPKNTVIIQSPISHSDSTESWVKSNRKIYLTVVRNSAQLIKLPEITKGGKSLAATKLAIVGLSPKWTLEPSPYKDAILDVKYKGRKVKAGFELPKGSEIEVVIGIGTEAGLPIPLPNFVGMTINEVNLELGDKQLVLNPQYIGEFETKEDSNSAIVTQQLPEFTKNKMITEGKEVMVIFEKSNGLDSLNNKIVK